jgi:hypothetical protein
VRRGLVAAVAVIAVGCRDKNAATDRGDAAGATTNASANVPSQASVPALPGCHASTPGDSVVTVPSGTLSLAASRGKALLVGTSLEGHARASRVVLGPSGVPESKPEPVTEALPSGGEVSTFGAAVALAGELTTLSYAVRQPAPSRCADGVLVAKAVVPDGPRRELLGKACRPATTFHAAARANLGVALPGIASAGAIDAFLFDGTSARAYPIEVLGPAARAHARPASADAGRTGAATIDVPTVAAGASSVGAAYVVVHGESRELHVARLTRMTRAAEPARVEVLDMQNVGTATLAFEEDTLHVVWSSFVPEKNRYVLRWSRWPSGGAPSAAQIIGTGVLSAIAPSLAIDHGRFMLAWAEGAERATTVKVGVSKRALAYVSGLASIVSTPGVSARDPVVALDADSAFVAWKELGPETAVRASAIKCQE